MAISSKMHRVGESVYYKEFLKPELNEAVGENSYKMEPIVGRRKLIIHTDRVSDEQLAAVKATAEAAMPATATLVQYNHNLEISWRDINKYAKCKTISELLAINPDYKKDLTSEGEWIYPLNSINDINGVLANTSYIKKATFYAPGIWGGNLKNVFFNCSGLVEASVYVPNAGSGEFAFCDCRKLKKVSGNLISLISGNSLFLNSPVETIEIEFPKLSTGVNFVKSTNGKAEYAPRLNKTSVLRIINSIPAYTSGTHNLDIGIHVDLKTDTEVLEAITNAEAKGWTLAVQWNGTSTSTASTMAMGQLIYARVSEIERPDGTTEQYIDWGHYVTNPEGYEIFRSLESAYAYFGLEMPNMN